MSYNDLELSCKMSQKGLVVKIKSELLEKYFKCFGSSHDRVQSHQLYNLDSGYQYSYLDLLNRIDDNKKAYISNRPNMLFVRSKGIAKGISYILDQPLNEEGRIEYLNDLKKLIINFYKEYIKEYMEKHFQIAENYYCQRCRSHVINRYLKNHYRFVDCQYCVNCYDKIMKCYNIEIIKEIKRKNEKPKKKSDFKDICLTHHITKMEFQLCHYHMKYNKKEFNERWQ